MSDPPIDDIVKLGSEATETKSRGQLLALVAMAGIVAILWILEFLNDDDEEEDETTAITNDDDAEPGGDDLDPER